MKKPFNEKVKRMYKRNVKIKRDNIIGIHKVDDLTVEYADGNVLVREKNAVVCSDIEAEIKKLPKMHDVNIAYPNTDNLFPQTEIKTRIRLEKLTLLKVLDCFDNYDVIDFEIRGEEDPIKFESGDTYGLFMPCRKAE